MQPIYFIQQKVNEMQEHAKKLKSVPDRYDLMVIGTNAEQVAQHIEQILKWGPSGEPGAPAPR